MNDVVMRGVEAIGWARRHAFEDTRARACERMVVGAVLAVTTVLAMTSPVSAHSGGHPLVAGAIVEIWTDPVSRHRVPGTLLYVEGGAAHIEDVAGGVHRWPLDAMPPVERARANAFRARVDALHRLVPVRPPFDDPERDQPLTRSPHAVRLAVWTAALGLFLLAFSVTLGRFTRPPVVISLTILAFACSSGAGGQSGGGTGAGATSPTSPSAPTPPADVAAFFSPYPSHVRTRQDADNLYVESDGLADHTLMMGIRSWQQQVPLPANYTGANAWTIPLRPRLADQPVSARTGLFRGAIALAVNGVPIFNALNNRGDDAYLAGELDDFGGHAGRADDYHYHTAPLFLSSTVGTTRPIAVALDGFLLYGSLEPDGSPMRALDDYNGHADSSQVYHYHGTRAYPYINGGMKGVVRVSDQVEPQPSLTPVRPAGTPLSGAVITRHAATGTSSWTLEYVVAGRTSRVDYRIDGTRVTFVFTDPSGASRTEVYGR